MITTSKKLYLTTNLLCTRWRNGESHYNKAHKDNTWFNNLVRACVRDLKVESKSYCFNKEQLAEIKKALKGVMIIKSIYKEDYGCYFITKVRMIK
jgi:hypothetical protein